MGKTSDTAGPETRREETPTSFTIFVALAAWLVPGLGHLLLRRRGRALVFFLVVGGLAVTGFLLRGNIFSFHGADAFDLAGFAADASSGAFCFIGHLMEKAGPDVSRAAGDDGTRFIAAAGVANLLCILDAIGIVTGARNNGR